MLWSLIAPRNAAARLAPRTSAKSPVRTRNPGARKAPDARVPVRSSRRCGSVVAWSSDRGPAISARKSPRKPSSSPSKALTERIKAGDVVVVDDLKLGSPKTKDFVGVISKLDLKGTTLVVSSGTDKNLTLASRNIEKVALTTSDSLNTYDVLRPDKLLFTKDAFQKVEARLASE